MQRIKKIGTTHNGENFEYWDYKNNTLNYHEKLGKGYPSQVNHEIITYSQLDQDVFVQRSTNFSENKTFVDIGAAHPIAINNTYLLESKYNWSGVSFELGINDVCNFRNNAPLEEYIDTWNKHRTTPIITGDVLKKDLKSIFKQYNLPKTIDYLSVDLEPPSLTYRVLYNVINTGYTFNYITFETDEYRVESGEASQTEINLTRDFMKDNNYILVNSIPAEDWYVHNSVYDENFDYSMRRI